MHCSSTFALCLASTFLRVVGSELIQKHLGDGPKSVCELLQAAEQHTPLIVFIEEIDALDGFDLGGDVKGIMATNKIETLRRCERDHGYERD
ncbi:hypothetical protein MJO28_006603 [Puccinia striiformis f. sp. tritici]|uniref:Uncharacterized protein n=1 Tax=Puccinia striiformis f. sp. tritici TaxID=168172 RepID=A0ACC0EKX4_9BASI|nr:hypothetical protein MJO28_006603 [Puccinia striiformis f. sp. tritici]